MKTILLIDDNKNICENLREYFELKGFKILVAENGKTGLELAEEFIPDLIICDVLMYEMDGYEVLRLILECSRTKNIPFIFSTSMAEKIDRTESLKLGADDYLVKPFELEALLKMSRSWIKSGSKRMQHAL